MSLQSCAEGSSCMISEACSVSLEVYTVEETEALKAKCLCSELEEVLLALTSWRHTLVT